MLSEGNRRMTLTSSSILWVPYNELHCTDANVDHKENKTKESATPVKQEVSTVSPPPKKNLSNESQEKIDPKILEALKRNSGVRKYPIFGKEHAYVRLLNNSLRGKVLYIVSGHGGPDAGAIGKQG